MSTWKDNAIWRCQMPQGKTERELQLELELEQAKIEKSWQQVRIQAAIAAMQGLISGGIYSSSSTIKLAQKRGQSGTEFIAQMATEFADDLIAELQKKGVE